MTEERNPLLDEIFSGLHKKSNKPQQNQQGAKNANVSTTTNPTQIAQNPTNTTTGPGQTQPTAQNPTSPTIGPNKTQPIAQNPTSPTVRPNQTQSVSKVPEQPSTPVQSPIPTTADSAQKEEIKRVINDLKSKMVEIDKIIIELKKREERDRNLPKKTEMLLTEIKVPSLELLK